MELDQLRGCYRLRPISVDPARFLLDPHNPRIALLIDDPSLLDGEIDVGAPAIQKAVLRVLARPEFSLSQLIGSIRQRGFVNDGSQMLVKRLGNKFLVLEGNRRTAAIRALLDDPRLMTSRVRESVQKIEVQEFSFIGNGSGFSERDVVEMLLGQIHISGKLSWGPMERADYIYQSYCRLSNISPVRLKDFRYDARIASRVGETFDCATKEVRTTIMIARSYLVLRNIGSAITPEHYSLLQLAITTRAVKCSVFGLSEQTFHFNETGAELFDQLCVRKGRIIQNPKDFAIFKNVAAYGDQEWLDAVMAGSQTLEQAKERMQRISEGEQFARQLERAFGLLQELPISAFRGTAEEKKLVTRVAAFVHKRLQPLGY